MTDNETAVQAIDIPAPENKPEEKTILGVFKNIYSALDAAGKLCRDPKLEEATVDLCAALDDIPQSDLDMLTQHITATYKNLENMRVTEISFGADVERKMVVATVSNLWGNGNVQMIAPFDIEGAHSLQKALGDAVNLIKPSSIIMPLHDQKVTDAIVKDVLASNPS